MNEKQVVKHRDAIQIEGKPSALQRKAYNILLAHAYNELPDEKIKTYQMEVSKIAHAWNLTVKTLNT